MSALAVTEAALAVAARLARRRRVRALSRAYDRARDLPRLAPSFADRPGHPFAGLRPGAVNDRPETTRAIMADLLHRLRHRLAARGAPGADLEARIDALRIALYGEARIYARQRAARFARAAAG